VVTVNNILKLSKMKEKKDIIKVDMIRMEGDVAPFIQVDYMDKNANEHTGLVLLDSASTVNILSPEMADNIGMLCKLEEKDSITSIADGEIEVEQVRFSFVFGGKQFSETFCITNNDLPIQVQGMEVLGLIGNQFLQKYRLVMDFSDYTLYTSEITPNNLSISDCSFFFPMEIGLKNYGLPVLAVRQKGENFVTMLDTGSTSNMISKKMLSDNDFRHSIFEEEDVITNVTGSVNVGKARVWFNILSVNTDDVCELSRHDRFSVLPRYVFAPGEDICDEDGDPVPPIGVLLGAPFIAKERWTLDFGANIVYKRKTTRRFYQLEESA
jgi:hypothetical protein